MLSHADTSTDGVNLPVEPPTPRSLVTRAQLARLAGVSRPAVTQACRDRLAAACEGRCVDTKHPSVVAWLAGPHPAGRVATDVQRVRRAQRLVALASELTDEDLDDVAATLVRVLERALATGAALRVRELLATLAPG